MIKKSCRSNHVEITWESLLPGDDCPVCKPDNHKLIEALDDIGGDLCNAESNLQDAMDEVESLRRSFNRLMDSLE